MSTVWMLPVVLLREPRSAVVVRLLGRAVVPALGLWLAGVPGTPWTGTIDWFILRIPVFAVAAVTANLWVFSVLNVFVNKRVVLRCMPTGSIERPRSLQERLLRIPQEYVIGKRVAVTPGHPQFMSRTEPKVTLSADGTIKRIPLHGTKTEDFVAQANALLKARNITFELVEAKGPPGYGEPLEGTEPPEPKE